MASDRVRGVSGERASCGIGFLASRKGVAERRLVDIALGLCCQFDHRGAPGHGSGILLDIPWPLLLERFPDHARVIAQRDVAVGMFFLPLDAELRHRCIGLVEDVAAVAGADVLDWADVPVVLEALPSSLSARRTAPIVRQALFRRPDGMREDAWFACRYLLRLALDERISQEIGDDFTLTSLSNRTIVYKGLAHLSRISDLYPDLQNPHYASRFVLFHSRYSTNTTTHWRRAQPFWSLAHNGEISTIKGNVAWMRAIGRDLLTQIQQRHPGLAQLASQVRSIICEGGSDSANLDDMLIALLASGLSLPQSIIALLPEAPSVAGEEPVLRKFHDAMSVFLGACDGPAAIVACDGDEAVAHLDRNGLRPLWILTSPDYAVAASELTGTLDIGPIESQKLLGPGETVVVDLRNGEVLLTREVHQELARQKFNAPLTGMDGQSIASSSPPSDADLISLQLAFGMTQDDRNVTLAPMISQGKAAVGSMGDDTPPAAMLDAYPRRLEDHFKLRFAQETSPPIDPIRDAWVFEAAVDLGDRSGLWGEPGRPYFHFENRLLSPGEVEWLKQQETVAMVSVAYDPSAGPEGIEPALAEVVRRARELTDAYPVIILSDRGVGSARAPLPALRAVSRLHDALVRAGVRHRAGIVADAGVWDIHHCALLVSVGADAVCPWLGCWTAGDHESTYLAAIRTSFIEAMSMMGVTPSSAYCGARLIEAVGLDREFLAGEFPGVPCHLPGIPVEVLNREWHSFYLNGFGPSAGTRLPDVGEFMQRRDGRPHANNAAVVRSIHKVAGYSRKPGARDPVLEPAWEEFSQAVDERPPLTVLDLVRVHPGEPVPLDAVEPEEYVLWRFMAPGMSEGALSEPAHRAIARAMNILHRYCRAKFRQAGIPAPPGIGPIANCGEGGFDKLRIGTRDGNRSIQYAGARFTITPMTAACAAEAEVKFAQGAKPGKGGQLPGRKVSARIAHQRGCEPGYELVSPPVNHNLYSIEDVKFMIESWRHLNPKVNCALKYVATSGIEMVALGGVHAGANRLHLSDGSGGTGAAKRVDQKHAGLPVAAVLPAVHDMLIEEEVRDLVEISVDGVVQSGDHVLKLILLGADRVAFGSTLMMALGCSMLRQCHLAGPHPEDPTGKRRIGCTPGVATQDPQLVAHFTGRPRNIINYLRGVAQDVRRRMAAAGISRLSQVVGRRDLLEHRTDLHGKCSFIDVRHLVNAPPGRITRRRPEEQTRRNMPALRREEVAAALAAIEGHVVSLDGRLTNNDRCVGVGAAGEIARCRGDAGLTDGGLIFSHEGAAGHFYAAYAVSGMSFRMHGQVADSSFTAAYGGRIAIVPADGNETRTLAGNTFAYGARRGSAFIAGGAGNRFGICLRKSHEGDGMRIVVQGVEANAFQYMTGGMALVLGPTGRNLGAGMTGGVVYLLDPDPSRLNSHYVQLIAPEPRDEQQIHALLEEHLAETGSRAAAALLGSFDPRRFGKIVTRLKPEPLD